MYFDIGANIGKWTLANINTTDKIIAIEASPTTYEKLQFRCKDAKKAVLLNYAVCNNGGEDITFYHAHCDTLSTINKDWLTSENSRFCNNSTFREIKCKTITIDTLIQQYGVPDLIKIDVEAGEYECITSLTQKVDLLCFEWAAEVKDITFKCLDYLVGLGFKEFYLQNEDQYVFRPTEFYDLNTIKDMLSKKVVKVDWGLVWCK